MSSSDPLHPIQGYPPAGATRSPLGEAPRSLSEAARALVHCSAGPADRTQRHYEERSYVPDWCYW